MPLAMHKDAMGAHLASVAAERQGRFWEFHDRLFANQGQLKLDDLKRHARALGLDMNRFEKDLVDLEINGEPRHARRGITLAELLGDLSLDPRAVVVEHNRHIVRRDALGAVRVADGDRFELVHFVGGG